MRTLLTLDLCGTREDADQSLDVLHWLCDWLLQHDAPHFVCWLNAKDAQMQTMQVTDAASLQKLLDALLETPLSPESDSIADRAFTADWRYHIQPIREENR